MSGKGSAGSGVIVVAVVPGQPVIVLEQAARLAGDLGVPLVCANVDPTRYLVPNGVDGTVVALPFDPDLPEAGEEAFDAELEQRIRETLEGCRVPFALRQLAGDPAWALACLADEVDARYIVVGTREAGLCGSVREFFTGYVAAHLAHRQHRPVVVVPLAPISGGEKLPWEGRPV